GIHASTAILYNHESPRRGGQFVTQKIVQGLCKINRGEAQALRLGNLTAIKDWGYARDYTAAMWVLAQSGNPGDLVFSTGVGRTVGDFVQVVAQILGLPAWQGLITVQESITRMNATETALVGASSPQAAQVLKHSISFEQLVELMVKSELGGTL